MKVLICGSRDYTNKKQMSLAMSVLTKDDWVIEGDAPGADRLAGEIAKSMGVFFTPVPAKWRDQEGVYNPQAGFERNTEMIEMEPDVMWAFFHKTRTPGTSDTVRKAKKAKIPVQEWVSS